MRPSRRSQARPSPAHGILPTSRDPHFASPFLPLRGSTPPPSRNAQPQRKLGFGDPPNPLPGLGSPSSSAPAGAGPLVNDLLRRPVAFDGMDCPKRSAPAGLPYDAIVETLARLPSRSVYRFKCVAKAWRDLIDDPLNRKKLPQTLEGFFFIDKPDGVASVVKHVDFINLLPRLCPPRFLGFSDSCNGLLLFDHVRKSNSLDVLGYIVCNPATKQWETVPTCSCCLPLTDCSDWYTFLAFDPAVSSHFHLIHFQFGGYYEEAEALDGQVFVYSRPVFQMCSYSSEAGTWSQSRINSKEQLQLELWHYQFSKISWHAFFNGILHLMILSGVEHDRIVALDVQGNTQRIITIPAAAEGRRGEYNGYMGHSQGRLHYINKEFNSHGCNESYVLSIWVLQDYDRQEWLLKDTELSEALWKKELHRQHVGLLRCGHSSRLQCCFHSSIPESTNSI